MDERPITAGGWAFYEIRGTVDGDASRFNYGVMAIGRVKVWVDDASLEFSDVPAEAPETAAARKEISLSYEKMNSLVVSRNLEGLLTFLTPDVMAISRGEKQPLRQLVAAMVKVGDVVWKSIRTEITKIELNGTKQKWICARPPNLSGRGD